METLKILAYIILLMYHNMKGPFIDFIVGHFIIQFITFLLVVTFSVVIIKVKIITYFMDF